MKTQYVWKTNVDYIRTAERLQSSDEVSYFEQTEKGLLQFRLNGFPKIGLQLTPKSKLNVYSDRIEDVTEVLRVLKRLLATDDSQCKFELLKVNYPKEKILKRPTSSILDDPEILGRLIEEGYVVEQ